MPLGFLLLFRYFWIVVDQRVERSGRSHESRVGHHPTVLLHQPLLLALRNNPAEYRLEDLFAEAIADPCERRVVRHVVGDGQPTEPAVGVVIAAFLTEVAVRRDPPEVSHELHAEVNFRIARAPTLPVRVARRRPF